MTFYATIQQPIALLHDKSLLPILESKQALLCMALAVSSAVSGVLASHIAYFELSSCSEPIKIQLRCLLFQKTLRRKDVVDSGSEGTEGRDVGPSTGGASKAAILNLFTLDVARVAGFANDGAGVIVAIVDRMFLLSSCMLSDLLRC